MNIRSFVLATVASLALSASAFAAPIFIPVGPQVITPQAPTIKVTPESITVTGQSSQSNGASTASGCMMDVLFPSTPGAQVPCPNVDANGTALSIATTNNGNFNPAVTTITPNAPLCSQPGIIIDGFKVSAGSKAC